MNVYSNTIMFMGRPKKLTEGLKERFINLFSNGYTDLEASQELGLNPATFYREKRSNKEFCDAILAAKRSYDYDLFLEHLLGICKPVSEYTYEEEVLISVKNIKGPVPKIWLYFKNRNFDPFSYE